MLWWENWSLRLGLVCTCGFAPPSPLCLGWEAPFTLYSTSAKQRLGLAETRMLQVVPAGGAFFLIVAKYL